MTFFNPLARLFFLLGKILENQEKESRAMSALTDAVASLTAISQADHEELSLVLAAVNGFPAQVQKAVADAIAQGASPEDLAAIKAVADQQATDLQAMKDALAATPPAG